MNKQHGLPAAAHPGVWSLVALVIGNMLGAGVFTTSGLALADLGSPGQVLLAWGAAGLVALCGALSYGGLARLMPVSGGEYLYLSRAVHPLAGFIGGWISLWAGFTAAIAFAAITLAYYVLGDQTDSAVPANTLATVVILLAALAHGLQVRFGTVIQNLAVTLKLAFICAFILFAGLVSDIGGWPGVQAWRDSPPRPASITAFAMTMVWISFSYSGFNASIYIASEVPRARHTVPRAILLGTGITMLLYLLLNAVFLFAPAPGAIAGQHDVAAVAASTLGGETLEILMRGTIVLALLTSISAMIMVGPRVYTRMAEDGLMPAALRFTRAAPTAAIVLQAALSIVVVWLAGLRELLSYLGFTLGLSSAATVACLFVLVHRQGAEAGRPAGYPWAPAVFILCTLLFAALAAAENPWEMLAAAMTILSAVVIYRLAGADRRRIGT